jgi:hypothetical protein
MVWQFPWSAKPAVKDMADKVWYVDGDRRKCVVPVFGHGEHVTPHGWGDTFKWRDAIFLNGTTGLELWEVGTTDIFRQVGIDGC